MSAHVHAMHFITSAKALTVLQHIPDDAKLVKVSTSAFTSKALLELDHDSLNVVLVQEVVRRERSRLTENQVGKLLDLDHNMIIRPYQVMGPHSSKTSDSRSRWRRSDRLGRSLPPSNRRPKYSSSFRDTSPNPFRMAFQ